MLEDCFLAPNRPVPKNLYRNSSNTRRKEKVFIRFCRLKYDGSCVLCHISIVIKQTYHRYYSEFADNPLATEVFKDGDTGLFPKNTLKRAEVTFIDSIVASVAVDKFLAWR